jgi:hypothetical protein
LFPAYTGYLVGPSCMVQPCRRSSSTSSVTSIRNGSITRTPFLPWPAAS